MNTTLTTITPYWGRPQVLRSWIHALARATTPWIQHLIYFVGEPVPDWLEAEYGIDPNFHFEPMLGDRPGDLSIGHYHNLGARHACSDWIMKLDVDTFPPVDYFRNLGPLLSKAGEDDWFNGGMIYLNASLSSKLILPLTAEVCQRILNTPHRSSHSYPYPEATNFICRRETYLRLGGCDERFRGWGWEDYQQIYMLERNRLCSDPLPGPITLENVTRRCRDEISRPKARDLWTQHQLCLLHCWHPPSRDPLYRQHSQANRAVLLDYILGKRSKVEVVYAS